MATGQIAILALIWAVVYAQKDIKIKEPTKSNSTQVTGKEGGFDVYTICPGNFTTCMRGSCAPYLPPHGHCIACKCNTGLTSHDVPMPKPAERISVGSISLKIGSMGQEWSSKILRGLKPSDLPRGKIPYLVYGITRSKPFGNETLVELVEHLQRTNFSDQPVVIPVVTRYSYGGSDKVEKSGEFKKHPGVLHLPFRLGKLVTRPLPGLIFPSCVLHQPYIQETDFAYWMRSVMSSQEVAMALPKIIEALYPNVPFNLSFTCGQSAHMPYGNHSIPGWGGKPWRVSGLLDLVKRFSYPQNVSTPFNNVLESLKRAMSQPNLKIDVLNTVKNFSRMIERLQLAGKSDDDVMKSQILNTVDLTELESAFRKFKNISSILNADKSYHTVLYYLLQSLGLQFGDLMVPLPPVNVNGSMPPNDPNARYFQKLSMITRRFATKNNGSALFDRIIKSLESVKINFYGEEVLKIVKKVRKFVNQLKVIGLERDDATRLKNLTFIDRKDFEEVFTKFRGIADTFLKHDNNFDVIDNFLTELLQTRGNESVAYSYNNKNYLQALMERVKTFSTRKNGSVLFDNILESLDNTVKNEHSAERRDITKIFRHFVEKLRNASYNTDEHIGNWTTMGINITALSKSLAKFREISGMLPKDRYFHFVEELVRYLSGGDYKNASYPGHHLQTVVSVASNSRWNACVMNQLGGFAYKIKFKTIMLGIEKFVCNDTKRMDQKNVTMSHSDRINETLRLIKNFSGGFSMEEMYLLWGKTYKKDTPQEEARIWGGIMRNLTKISKIDNWEERKNETEKFWKWIPRVSDTFAIAYMNHSKFGKIRELRRRLMALMPPFGDPHSSTRMLCNMTKKILAKIGNSNVTYADMLSRFQPNIGGRPVGDNGYIDIVKVTAFVKRYNITVPRNMSLYGLADLITSSGRAFVQHARPYARFVSNITRIAKYFPYNNRSKINQCLQKIKEENYYPAMTMNASSYIANDKQTRFSCFKHIFQPYLKDDSPFTALKRELWSIILGNGDHPNVNHTDPTSPEYVHDNSGGYVTDTISTQHVVYGGSCAYHVVPGLMVPRHCAECANNSRETAVYFKTRSGNMMMGDAGFAMMKGQVFTWSLLWINAGPGFNATKFLHKYPERFMNATTHPGSTTKEQYHQPKLITFMPGDDIEEVFVTPNDAGDINVKAFFGDNTTRWAVLISSGGWIVKDEAAATTGRTKRSDKIKEGKEKERPEIPSGPKGMPAGGSSVQSSLAERCSRNLTQGWRCLLAQDNISSDAVLRLLHSNGTFALGVIALAPLDDGASIEGAFNDTAKVKNMVATVLPEGEFDKDAQRVEFDFAKQQFHATIMKGTEKIVKLQDIVKITNLGESIDIEKMMAFVGTSTPVSNLWSKIKSLVEWPEISFTTQTSVVANDFLIKYRPNQNATWKLLRTETKGMFKTKQASTGELSIQLKSGDSRGVKIILLSMENGGKAVVHLKIATPPKKLSMLVPKGFRIPAVPFKISENDGFLTADVLANVLPGTEDEDDNVVTGIAVVSEPKSNIGEWQTRCELCPLWEWSNMSVAFEKMSNARKRRTALKSLGKFRFARRAGECVSAKDKIHDVLLLSPRTRVRFQPKEGGNFWKATEARTKAVIALSLYRIQLKEGEMENESQMLRNQTMQEIKQNGQVVIKGSYENNPACGSSVWDLRTLLSPERANFPIERVGCDGKRSSMKIKVDTCGVCGGKGKSCTDCNGTLKGDAYLDGCGKCVGGETKLKPSTLDCGRGCNSTNYLDECNFCQRRGKHLFPSRDCAGDCFGTARLDKCGSCRRADGTVVPGQEGGAADLCGVCSGDNSSCSGCDGVPNSEKKEDNCGQCKDPKDESYNQGCKVYALSSVHPSIAVVNKRVKAISFTIYGLFDTHQRANCSLTLVGSTSTRVHLGDNTITDSKLRLKGVKPTGQEIRVKAMTDRLLPNGMTFAMWNISCRSGMDETTLKTPLLVRTTDPWALNHSDPKYISTGGGGKSVTIMGTNFPSDVELVCVASHYVFASLEQFAGSKANRLVRMAKLISLDASFIDNTRVSCQFPNLTTPAKIKVYVLTKREVMTASASAIVHSVDRGVTLEYREKAPGVKVAKLTSDLEFVTILFDTDVVFLTWGKSRRHEKFCSSILEEGSTILGKRPRCYVRGSRYLLIKPGQGAATTGTSVTLKAGILVGRSGGGATEPFPETNVTIQTPEIKVAPQVYMKVRREIEPCDYATVAISITNGVGVFAFSYIWTVEVEESTSTNSPESIKAFLEKTSQRQTYNRISFKDFEGTLQPGGNYTVGLQVENAFGKTSEKVTVHFHVKSQNSAVRVAIRGPPERTVRASAKFSVKADAKFLKPKCKGISQESENENFNASSLGSTEIAYIWNAADKDGDPITIDSNTDRRLDIQKRTLKPGNYKFTVTAFYYKSDVIAGEASHSALITVEGGPIIAYISGPKSRVVMSDEILALDGSRSFDPDGGDVTYSWTCEELVTGIPCSVTKGGNSTENMLERADAVFPSFQANGKLEIPASRFKLGLLAKITLTVRSGDREAADFVRILIQDASDNLPKIAIRLLTDSADETFPINKMLRVKATLIGNKNKDWTMISTWTCVEEEGLTYVDLSTVNKTAVEKVQNVTSTKLTHFSLVLAKDALRPGSTYKFQLHAQPDPDVHPVNEGEDVAANTVFATIEIKTSPTPTGGTFTVTPGNGSALETEFTLQAVDWTSGEGQDAALEYRFGYVDTANRKEGKGKTTYFGSFITDQPEMAAYLPPGDPRRGNKLLLIALVRIEGSENGVRTITTEVVVEPPQSDTTGEATVDEATIQTMINQAAEAMVSGDRAATISRILLVRKTVRSDKTRREVRDLAEAAIKTMKIFKPTSESDAEDALDSVNNLIGAFIGNVTTSEGSKKIALQIVDATMKELYNKKDPNDNARRRRAAETTSTAKELSTEMAERMLGLYDTIFQSSGNEESFLQNARTNFKENSEFIMQSFCTSMDYDEPALITSTGFTSIGAQKVTMPHQNSYGYGSITFSFSEEVEQQYSSWQCDSAETTPCSGACVSFGSYQGEVLQSYENPSSTTRISPITGLFIRDPSDGRDATSTANTTGLNNIINISFSNLTISAEQESTLECRHLDDSSVWSNGSCIVTSYSYSNVVCQCDRHYGYFAIFARTPDTTTTTTTTTTRLIATTRPTLTSSKTTSMSNSCASPLKLAVTCPGYRYCLDMCDEGECKEVCHPGESCICPQGMYKTRYGKCVDTPDCPEPPVKPTASGMTAAAIVGLAIAIVAVTGALVFVVYLYHKKANKRQVTPTTSMAAIEAPPMYSETYMGGSEDNKVLIPDEKGAPEQIGIDNKVLIPDEKGAPEQVANDNTIEPTAPLNTVEEAPPESSEKSGEQKGTPDPVGADLHGDHEE